MSPSAWILVGAAALLLAFGAAAAAWAAARRSRPAAGPDPAAALALMQQQLLDLKNEMQRQVGDLTRTLNDQMLQSQKTIGERLEGTSRVMAQVHGQLGALAKTAENMQEMGRTLGDLQNILKAPKLRGLMGESLMAELLREALPGSAYSLQHTFRSGATVDAIIRLGEGLVPVDAKFPLESFDRLVHAGDDAARRAARRDFVTSVRGRINEIADKYILPEEGTYNFALMYIPAESVFHEVFARADGAAEVDLAAFARERHVFPVSPHSFYAYLTALAFGLRGLRIEKEALAVFARVRGLQQTFAQFLDLFNRLGKQIGFAQGNYLEARRQADRLQDGLGALSGADSAPAALEASAVEHSGGQPTPALEAGDERPATG
jgi:DNA recombination protein RmuC